jgi:RES domain-containing protein
MEHKPNLKTIEIDFLKEFFNGAFLSIMTQRPIDPEDREEDDVPICLNCIEDGILRAEVSASNHIERCCVCDREDFCWTSRQYAQRIQPLFEKWYVPSSPEYFAGEVTSPRGLTAGEVISEMTGAGDDKASEAILGSLKEVWWWWPPDGDEDPLDDDLVFNRNLGPAYQTLEDWRQIEEEVRTRSRFFNPIVEEKLRHLFAGIESLTSADGRPVVRRIVPNNPGNVFWRMRVVSDQDQVVEVLKDPEAKLGPPPPGAASAGRMNARGISVFYGAEDPATCVGEVRAAVGSFGIIASFEVTRELKVLDVSALQAIRTTDVSIFDSEFSHAHGRTAFLQHLQHVLQLPVLPGEEADKYLVTQMIAEYLGSRHPSRLDGVLYPSIQTGKRTNNVVLFAHASRVQPSSTHRKIEVRTPGWDDPELSVIETNALSVDDDVPLIYDEPSHDSRIPALRLVLDDIRTVGVFAVKHEVQEYKISWTRTPGGTQ